ncbi:hypothetical protein AN643_02520 [Candidatus Epulonipiscioides saccharophilum]|nr:hypothetical protein AN643_02520 [Epulopiscium sp. SCG-B10WGA-EpuloB]
MKNLDLELNINSYSRANYFDTAFFNRTIERLGEFNMTFTEEIQGYRTRINTAKEEGLAEGRYSEKIEIAMNFLKDGFGIDCIMKNTGLPEEEVKRLQAEIEKS